MIILIMGPQGSGKGSVAERLAHDAGYVHISTGDLLRAEIRTGSALGKSIEKVIDKGGLVSDGLIMRLLKKHLSATALKKGVLLDGFPRDKEQARALDKEFSVDCGIALIIPDSIAVARISNRVQCTKCGEIYGTNIKPKRSGVCDKCGGRLTQREDDTPAAVRKRLATYHKETELLLAMYKKIVHRIDATADLQTVVDDVERAIKRCRTSA